IRRSQGLRPWLLSAAPSGLKMRSTSARRRPMHLLPRTVRGTVLLAAVAWSVAAVVLWEVLPVRPRRAWPTPGPGAGGGFLPDGHSLVTQADGRAKFHVWDADRGRLRATLETGSGLLAEGCLSPDGRWLVVRQALAPGTFIDVLDVASGEPVARFDAGPESV